jgi:hypothetical protein
VLEKAKAMKQWLMPRLILLGVIHRICVLLKAFRDDGEDQRNNGLGTVSVDSKKRSFITSCVGMSSKNALSSNM